MDKTKIRELLEFAGDEKRVNAAFDRVIEGIESGKITGDDFPIPAGPLNKAFAAPDPFSTDITVSFSGEALDSLNRYRAAAYAARMTSEGDQAALEVLRLRAASDLAGWVSALASVRY